MRCSGSQGRGGRKDLEAIPWSPGQHLLDAALGDIFAAPVGFDEQGQLALTRSLERLESVQPLLNSARRTQKPLSTAFLSKITRRPVRTTQSIVNKY